MIDRLPEEIGQVYAPDIQLSPHEIRMPSYDSQINLACFSGDGQRVLTVKEVGTAKIWEIDTRILVGEITPTSPMTGMTGVLGAGCQFELFIEAVALNQHGDIALLGLNDGTAGLFSVADGRRLFTFAESERAISQITTIRAVIFSADETLVAVGFFNRNIGVWDARSGELITLLQHPQGHRYVSTFAGALFSLVSAIVFSADRTHLFARCGDGVAFIWNYQTGALVYSAFDYVDTTLTLTKDDAHVRWATAGGIIWEVCEGGALQRILDSSEYWRSVSFATDGQALLAMTQDGYTQWILSGKSIHHAEQDGPVSALHGQIPASGPALIYYGKCTREVGWENKYLLYEDGELLGEFNTGRPFGFPFAVNWERHLAAVLEANTSDKRIDSMQLQRDISVAVYGLPSGECVQRIPLVDCFSARPSFSPDGKILTIVTEKREPVVIDGQQTWRPLHGLLLVETDHWQYLRVINNQKVSLGPILFGPNNAWFFSFYTDERDHAVGVFSQVNHPNWPSNAPLFFWCRGDRLKQHMLSDGRTLVLQYADGESFIEIWRPPLPDETAKEYCDTYLLYTISLEIHACSTTPWHITDDEHELLITSGRNTIYHYNLDSGALIAQYAIEQPKMQEIPDNPLAIDDLALFGQIWSGEGGPYIVKISGEFRAFGFMALCHSADKRYVVLANEHSNAYVVSLADSPHRVVATIPHQGKYRAAHFNGNQVTIVDSFGGVNRTVIVDE